MDIRYLKTLVTAIETGSFSKAAEILHLTQSAVSQRIKFLEERLGHQLLIRSGQSMALTPAGTLVIEGAKEILEIQNSLWKDLDRLSKKRGISLCCTPTFGTVYLPEVLNIFMRQDNSSVDLNFIFHSPGQAVEGVRSQEFDVAIVEHCQETDLNSFHSYDLPSDELVFVSSPALGLASPNLSLDDLLRARLFARRDGCSSKELVRSGLLNSGKTLDDFSGVVISDDLRLTCQSVVSGGGVSFVSKHLVKEYLDRGELVAHYVDGFTRERCRTIIMNKGRENDELLQSFVNCIYSVMGMQAAV